MALPDVVFTCEPALSLWRMVINGCTYEASFASNAFSCDCGGTLTLTTPGCCPGAPSAITVSPAGTWTSCGDAEPVCGAAFTVNSLATPPPPVRKSLPVCSRLGPSERVAGSTRDWRRCGGGHGTPANVLGGAAAGLVTTCGACRSGEWRVGQECGPRCPGYAAAESAD